MKKDGERLAAMEVEMKNLQNGMDMVNKSIENLHGKVDSLTSMLMENYVSKNTFEEYKKNRWLERIIIIILTALASGIVAYILRVNKI